MSTGMRERAEAIFLVVADMPRDRWDAEIAARCGDDAALDYEVRSLLDCHKDADHFLDAAELGHARPIRPLEWEDLELQPGTRLGEYVIQRVLGKGGMGHVYIAEQDRPRRTVALKVIRRGLGTSGLLRRFEHEAEILGRLQHPGIAQIYEAGAAKCSADDDHAQPYIAMELIDGPPLNIHADNGKLSTSQRLELVARVCDAVHHAHQRGVIHRDLKPANILVDQHGQPKILDFGIARAADVDLLVTTMQTSVGQLMGTLPYMSPEQVAGDPREVDNRSDVYAMGVILYQLLTGRLPLDVSSRSLIDAARVIKGESPTRLGQVSRIFRGDVETIVSKALDKDKTRRYQSAADLAADIRRYLAGHPIDAKRDSSWYILKKAVRRHRVPFAAAATILVLLAASSVVSWTLRAQAVRAESEAKLAATRENAARRTAEASLYDSLLAQARSTRRTGRAGHRFETLDAIKRAAAVRPSLELRNEAIAAMTLTDLRPLDLPVSKRTGESMISFDAALEHCAILQVDHSILVVRIKDNVVTSVVPPPQQKQTQCFVTLTTNHLARCYWSSGEQRWMEVWSLQRGAEPTLALSSSRLPYQGYLDISADERLLAVSLDDSAVHLFDLQTYNEIKRIPLESNPKYLSFSPDAKRLAIFHGEFASKACIIDIETGERTRIYDGAAISWALRWSPDGKHLAGGDGFSVQFWDLDRRTSTGNLPIAHSDLVTDLVYSPDGNQLITRGWDGAPVLWDPRLFIPLVRLQGGYWASGPRYFSTDGTRMGGLESDDGWAWRPIVYELSGTSEFFRIVPQATQTATVGTSRASFGDFTTDGRILFFYASADDARIGGLYLFDMVTCQELAHLPAAGFGDVVVDPAGKFVLVAGANGLWRWPIARDTGVLRLGPPTQVLDMPDLTRVDLSTSGRVVATRGDGPCDLITLDLDSPGSSRVLRHANNRPEYDLDMQGRYLAALDSGETVIWDRTSEVSAANPQFRIPGRQVPLAFNRDDTIFATTDFRELTLWETGTWRRLRSVVSSVDHLTFSPDGSLVAARSLSRIHLIRTDTLEIIATLESPDVAPRSFAFTPDGGKLAVFMSRNLATYVWDLRRIREHLVDLNLDWNLPPYIPADERANGPLRVEIDRGSH